MRWLVTGGCGFIGSHFVELLLTREQVELVLNLDALTYAGTPRNVAFAGTDPRYRFVRGDIVQRDLVEGLLERYRPHFLVNFAAESHVDRSIGNSAPFLHTNVLGTESLLRAWLSRPGRRFLQVSTDEVYGSIAPPSRAAENASLLPGNPYSASKAAADLLVQSYNRTYGMDVVITRSCNNLGARQHPEKLIPRMVTLAIAGRSLPVFGDGLHVREWLDVKDHCRALFLAATRGRAGSVYNIGSGQERSNLHLVECLLDLLGKPASLISFIQDRPGHDRRYALDSTLIRKELGWEPTESLETSLPVAVRWNVEHLDWWSVEGYPDPS